jgi:xanthine dehydrogenase YagR molybdenum-binding subunit
MTTTFIGQPVSRVDGRQKVTGGATYAAEFNVANVAHAAVVRSTVASGRITAIDTAEAERAGGCAVLSYRNAPRLYRPTRRIRPPASAHVLQNDQVNHQGQPSLSWSPTPLSRPTTRQGWCASPTRPGREPTSPRRAILRRTEN